MSTYVDIPRSAFQAMFDESNAKLAAADRPAWQRWVTSEVHGELAYQIDVAREGAGPVVLVVYTSIAYGQGRARPVGKDAIRVALVFADCNGRRHGISSEAKVLRVTSVEGVMARVRERVNVAWQEAKALRRCAECGSPAYADSGRCVVRACREGRKAWAS